MTRENRRSTRIRRVQPIAFRAGAGIADSARRTVSANVSEGGMLLVTRQDAFPAAGTTVDLLPQPSTGTVRHTASIPGRIVYTRFSPEANLRFAGLEFGRSLTPDAARSLGLHEGEDNVVDALKTLQALEQETPEDPPVAIVDEEMIPEAVWSESEHSLGPLHDACAEFVAATCAFMRDWAQAKVLERVLAREALSRAKGVEGLRPLKRELASLLEDYTALTDAQLDRDELWAHRGAAMQSVPRSQLYFDEENARPPRWLVDELRKLMGFTGVLLIKHGFDEISTRSSWSPLSHEQALVAYRGPFAVSEDMNRALKRASQLFAAMPEQSAPGDVALDASGQASARQLWDEA